MSDKDTKFFISAIAGRHAFCCYPCFRAEWTNPKGRLAAVSAGKLHIFRINDAGVRIGGDDLLANGLRAPAEEEKAARHAVDDLTERIDAFDAAADRIGQEGSLDPTPRIVPAEEADRIPQQKRIASTGDDRIVQRSGDFGVLFRNEGCRSLESADSDA